MRFADKLFFTTTALLAVVFAVFGIWMVSSYFQNILNREIERADTESRMLQYLFEVAYRSTQEYGEEYAVLKAVDSSMNSVEKQGRRCFAVDADGNFLYGDELGRDPEFLQMYEALRTEMGEEDT